MIYFLIGGIIFSVFAGIIIGKVMQGPIDRCFELRVIHDKLLTGKIEMKYILDSDLIDLRKPLRTVVGMGGVGPSYLPSFDVFQMVLEELTRRRDNRNE